MLINLHRALCLLPQQLVSSVSNNALVCRVYRQEACSPPHVDMYTNNVSLPPHSTCCYDAANNLACLLSGKRVERACNLQIQAPMSGTTIACASKYVYLPKSPMSSMSQVGCLPRHYCPDPHFPPADRGPPHIASTSAASINK